MMAFAFLVLVVLLTVNGVFTKAGQWLYNKMKGGK